MTLKFVIILQNLIKTYHRKSGKSKCDRKVTKLNVEITWIRSRVRERGLKQQNFGLTLHDACMLNKYENIVKSGITYLFRYFYI